VLAIVTRSWPKELGQVSEKSGYALNMGVGKDGRSERHAEVTKHKGMAHEEKVASQRLCQKSGGQAFYVF
jgi:hypothetical protein